MVPVPVLSPKVRSVCFSVLSALALGLLVFSCTTPKASEPDWAALRQGLDSAWTSLWANDYAQAEKAFQAVKSLPRFAAEASRGIALASYARGDVEGWLKSGVGILDADPSSARSAVLFDQVSDDLDSNLWHPSWPRYMDMAGAMSGTRHAPWLRMLGLEASVRASKAGMAKKNDWPKDLVRLSGWTLAGPFDLAWADRKPDLDAMMVKAASSSPKSGYTLPDGASGTWSDFHEANLDGSINPAGFFGARNIYAYAQSNYELAKDSEFWLVLDRDCGIRVWIDGNPVLDDMEYRSGRQMHWIRVKLAKGRHAILARLLDRDGSGSFTLTLVPVDRDSSFDLAASKVIRSLPGLEKSQDTDQLLGRLAARLEAGSELEGLYCLVEALESKGYPETALALLRDPANKVPAESALFTYLESRVLRDLGMGREADAKVWTAGEKGNDFAPALQSMAWRAFHSGRYDEVKSLVDRLNKNLGANSYISQFYWTLAEVRQKGNEALGSFRSFMGKYPLDQTLPAALLASGDTGINRTAFTNALNVSVYPRQDLGELFEYLEDGDQDKLCEQVASRMKTVYPGRADAWYYWLRAGYMGSLEAGLKKFPASLSILRLAVFRDLFVYQGVRNLGSGNTKNLDMEAFGKLKDELAGWIRKLLPLNPENWELRKKLREVEGKSDLDLVLRQTDVRDAIKSWIAEPFGQDRDVVMVKDDSDTVYFPDGGFHGIRSTVLRIGSAMGLDWESTRYLPGHVACKVLEAYCVRPDGSLSWAEISGRSVSYPGAKVGDFLVLSYVIDGKQGMGNTGDFWDQEYFSNYYPQSQKRYRILYPKNLKPAHIVHNDPEGRISVKEGSLDDEFASLEFSVKNLDRQILGAGAEYRDKGAWTDVSTLDSWDKVSQWYSRIADYRAFPSFAIRSKAAELVGDVRDRKEKIRRLYDFASNGIRYEDLQFQYSAFVPQWAESVMDDQFGDCKDKACLFIALLRAVGIEARFALSAPDYTGPYGFLPSNRFSHAFVIIPGGLAGDSTVDLVIDPTTEFFTFPSLPLSMEGTRYLPIPGRTSTPEQVAGGLKTLPVISRAERIPVVSYLEASPRLDRMPVSGVLVCREDKAARVRSISQSNDPQYRQRLFRSLLAESYPGIEVQSVEASFAGNLDSSPVLKFKATLPPQVRKLKNDPNYRMDLPWGMGVSHGLKDLAGGVPEGQSLDISGSLVEVPQVMTLLIQLPSNFFLGIKPADETFTFQNARAKFSYVQEGSLLSCTFELSVPPTTVAAKDARDFGNFVNEVWNKQTEYLLLGAGF